LKNCFTFLFINAGHKKDSASIFTILLSACIAFILSFHAVSAAETTDVYRATEVSLTDNLKKFDATFKNIEKRVAALKKIEALNEAQQSELSLLIQAQDFIRKSIESVDRSLQYIRSAQIAPQQLKTFEQSLEAPLQDEELKPESIDETQPLEKLEVQYGAIRKELSAAQKYRTETEQEITRRNERQPKLQGEQSLAQKRIDELHQAVSVTAPEQSSDLLKETQNAAKSAELDYLNQLIHELELEDSYYNQQRELSRAQRQFAERKVLIAEKNNNIFEQVINKLRAEAAARVKEVADTASQAADAAHPLVRAIMEENKLFAAELEQITVDSAALSEEKKTLTQSLTSIQRNYDRIREKIAQTGLTNAIGLKLRNDRKQLPDISLHEKKIKLRNLEINRVQLRRIELEDRLLERVDLNEEVRRRMEKAEITLDAEEEAKLLPAMYEALLKQKDDYLDELINAYDVYFEKRLFPMLDKEQKLITLVRDYKDFIDTRILWIQSAPIIQLQDIERLGAAVAWFLDPESWITAVSLLGRDLGDNMWIIVPLLFVFATLLFAQHYLKEKLVELGRYVTKLSKARYIDTLWTVMVTLLMALPWPLLIYLFSWRIQQMNTNSAFVNAFALGFTVLAYLLFAGLLLRHLCRKDGLGELHFRWKAESMMLIRRQLAWFLPAALPLVFVFVVTMEQPTEAHHESLGRLMFFILMTVTTVLIYRLMHPSKGLLQNYLEKNDEGWISRLSGLWFSVLLITPFGMAFTAAIGYMYTAGQLSLLIIHSVLLVFAVIIARALLIRWLNIAQRKLAIEQWRRKFAAQAESAQGEEKNRSADTSEQIFVEEAMLDVETINTQTMKLLNTAYWFAIVVGIALIWSQVLPAFTILNDIVLWSTEITGSEDGKEVKSLVPITLASLLLAVIIFLMTFFISNNIPGLLEIAILQRLPFTPSGRYAIASIARYFIIIIGFAMTFNALGIGWSKVQWLAAAVTVGLGFGLQEIFANFVSGLIILFERPVRVGDIVTVGNISGKVSRIQMRATTIIDWDRKELIIPNKEFVTGQVINWSLTDSILRILIPVGIVYGSNTKLANEILLSVAKNHPDVLKEPEPSSRFVGFGESALNFELRVFIPDPDLLLEVRHDLLMEIDQRFREEKIEIAFPHQDIHIKSLPDEIKIVSRSVNPGLAKG
jgi:potassium-dependent mechanosensitive channel